MDTNDIKFKKWFSAKGKEFFIKCGVKEGFKILEFGAGYGNYTAALSLAAGKDGIVYAVESDHAVYEHLNGKIKEYNLENVIIFDTGGRIDVMPDPGFDFVLFYDVIHYFNNEDRNKLYDTAYSLLNKQGILSIFPKHRSDDAVPRGDFGKMNLEDIKNEITGHGFCFKDIVYEEIVHDGNFAEECVLNFTK